MLSVSNNINNKINNNGMGCNNISMTLSDGSFENEPSKKSSFFDNLLKKNSSSPSLRKNDKSIIGSWANIFAKKDNDNKNNNNTNYNNDIKNQTKQDEETAELIASLQSEGKSEADIDLLLSYIHDVPSSPAPAPVKSKNVLLSFINDVQQAFKEIGFSEDVYYSDDYYYNNNPSSMTVSISSAPFYGALPPNTDMNFMELANLEPVYMGNHRCINNLPSCIHNGEPLPGDQIKCPVCLSNFEEGETLKSLPCIHFYHEDCIDSWLLVGHTCPMCKALVE